MQYPQPASLVRLSDSELLLANPSEDVRGRTVCDACGDDIGRVHDLLVDEDQQRLRFICVDPARSFGRGARRYLIPVEAITRVSSDSVRIDRDADQVTLAPECEPDFLDADWMERLYDYYGYAPFWATDDDLASLPFHY